MTQKKATVKIWVEKDGTVWAKQSGNLTASQLIVGMAKLTTVMLTKRDAKFEKLRKDMGN